MLLWNQRKLISTVGVSEQDVPKTEGFRFESQSLKINMGCVIYHFNDLH